MEIIVHSGKFYKDGTLKDDSMLGVRPTIWVIVSFIEKLDIKNDDIENNYINESKNSVVEEVNEIIKFDEEIKASVSTMDVISTIIILNTNDSNIFVIIFYF